MHPKAQQLTDAYYHDMARINAHRMSHESATRTPFQTLLTEWGRPYDLTLIAEYSMPTPRQKMIRLDGALVSADYPLPVGAWEAKDLQDKLDQAIEQKIRAGYPLENTLFENTHWAVLYQRGQQRMREDIRQDSGNLAEVLDRFVSYRPPHHEDFQQAIQQFRIDIPRLAARLTSTIDEAKATNPVFLNALSDFLAVCRAAINTSITATDVEEMLKQHLLTERIFRGIFQNPDFVRRNPIAIEIEKVVDALTSQSFSRDTFLQRLDYFYRPIEKAARLMGSQDYASKQMILNYLYEEFFQAYSTDTADTHGIVYTPLEIVRWMVRSVNGVLKQEFGRSLASRDVHILDPCVGTGGFIAEVLDQVQQIDPFAVPRKYAQELHANEVLLLPYYVAAQNIEHKYMEQTGNYAPFPGLCFVDTLDLQEDQQPQLPTFAPMNTRRIETQKATPIQVIVGNPPYNVGQENENDNNKNRPHPSVDKRVQRTYAKASRATNKNALSDMYVKFFRWAVDRLGDQDGIVCFISNNSFLDQISFDGMRQHLLNDFTQIYMLDLGGNVRKNPKLSGTKHNVFGIQVGVAITILVRNSQHSNNRQLWYSRVEETWTKGQKLDYLQETGDYRSIPWQLLTPDSRNTWLTEGLVTEFDTFLPMGNKEAKASRAGLDTTAIFKTYGRGIATCRDDWAYAFKAKALERNIRYLIENYNSEVDRWMRRTSVIALDDFLNMDDTRVKWSETLKRSLQRGLHLEFAPAKIRYALYRPFCTRYLYFDRQLNERVYIMPTIFPTPDSEQENSLIWLKVGTEWPMFALVANTLVDLLPQGGSQCFPYYTYSEDGTARRENITDWALDQFRAQYGDSSISKWDIFYYCYAVLYSSDYRTRYAANLKRDLPHIPFVPPSAFAAYVGIGRQLAALHRDYAKIEPYPLHRVFEGFASLSWQVDERGMKLSKDRTILNVTSGLRLEGIPPTVFEYRLGGRSALEWVIDQYRVSVDARTGIRHDPNNPDDPEAIVRLVGQVVRVSVETVDLVKSLPPLE